MILTFGGAGGRDPIRHYASGGFRVYLGGFQVALGAIDVLRRQSWPRSSGRTASAS